MVHWCKRSFHWLAQGDQAKKSSSDCQQYSLSDIALALRFLSGLTSIGFEPSVFVTRLAAPLSPSGLSS
jgi:hypothetical protein